MMTDQSPATSQYSLSLKEQCVGSSEVGEKMSLKFTVSKVLIICNIIEDPWRSRKRPGVAESRNISGG